MTPFAKDIETGGGGGGFDMTAVDDCQVENDFKSFPISLIIPCKFSLADGYDDGDEG